VPCPQTGFCDASRVVTTCAKMNIALMQIKESPPHRNHRAVAVGVFFAPFVYLPTHTGRK